jgi:hypothetical protein
MDETTLISHGESSAAVSNISNELMKLKLIATSNHDDIVRPAWTLWLHVKWRRACYLAYSEYYFEAWITSTKESDGPRVSIDQLDLRWRHGGTRGQETRNGEEMVAKEDRTYAYGITCETDLCTRAVATHQGVAWTATTPDGCVA